MKDVSELMIKILPNPDMTVCATFKASKCENFYDRGDMVKVKLMPCNKRSCHYASLVYISSLYPQRFVIYEHLSVPLVFMGKFNFGP